MSVENENNPQTESAGKDTDLLNQVLKDIRNARSALDGPGVPVELFTKENLPNLSEHYPKAFEILCAIANNSRTSEQEKISADEIIRELGLNPALIDNGDRRFILIASSIGKGKEAVETLHKEALLRINDGEKISKANRDFTGFIKKD